MSSVKMMDTTTKIWLSISCKKNSTFFHQLLSLVSRIGFFKEYKYCLREGQVNKCLFLFLISVNSLEEVLSTFFMYHCGVIGGESPHFLCLAVADKKYNVG